MGVFVNTRINRRPQGRTPLWFEVKFRNKKVFRYGKLMLREDQPLFQQSHMKRDSIEKNSRIAVHFTAGPYLPITEGWIYGQINNLLLYRPVVYAAKTMNLDVFPTERIRNLTTAPKSRVLSRLLLLISFLSFAREDKPKVIHAHFGPSGHAILPLKRLLGVPMITSFYGYDLSRLVYERPEWKRKYRSLFTYGDLFLVEGNHMRKTLVELGCPENKARVQHLGVDLDRIPFVSRTREPDEPVRVLAAASFREKKGLVYAVEAFGKLKIGHPRIKMQMTIIGDSSGSPEEEYQKKTIVEMIEKYDLSNQVVMMGYQPVSVFVRELYRHQIFLSPSVHALDGDTEGGIPVAIIEASASGMPVVSTTHCDIPEAILQDRSGFLVPERDPDALAEKLSVLVSTPEIWGPMGASGREHIETHYDVKKQSRKLETIYDALLC